jgi:signal transduction histidine kinase
MFGFISKRLFGKVFILIFLAIFMVLFLFTTEATRLQKESIISSLESESKTMADAMTLLNKENLIIDNKIGIFEFLNEYVKLNKQIESVIISRNENAYNIIIKKESWDVIDSKNEIYESAQNDFVQFSIITSPYLNKKVFKYTYPIYFSNILWGWLHIDVSLIEYDKKIEQMYLQFIFLAIFMLITSIFLSYFIAKMVAKPIVSLNNVSNEIARGNLSIRANITTNDEIGILAKTYNKMLENLENSQNELKNSRNKLELRVQERTKELEDVNSKLEEKSKLLKELNDGLEERVKEEIRKQQKQEQLLIQQSKLAAMGEMIGNIAHQWRQPLNALSLVLQNINFAYEMDDLSEEFMHKSMDKANLLTNTMSKTIDDFRNFFKPNKQEVEFFISDAIKNAISLIESTFQHHNITIESKINDDANIKGFPNEFSQVVLNILNNAKDAIIENNIGSGKVLINVEKIDNKATISVIDNAGGIPNDILEKVFNPYFTTKEEGKGTGIGLYMSKNIIETNMNGKLLVENIENGAKFVIIVPILENKND